MSKHLYDYVIAQSFDRSHGECNTHHLSYCAPKTMVAITPKGLKEHNEHDTTNKLAIGGSVGLALLPVLGIGGIGLVGGGLPAIGATAAEVALVGGGVGFTGGAVTAHNTKMHGHKATKTTADAESMKLVNMVGRIINRQERWWGQPGYDVEVKWFTKDADGDSVTTTSWHDPEHLVRMKLVK